MDPFFDSDFSKIFEFDKGGWILQKKTWQLLLGSAGSVELGLPGVYVYPLFFRDTVQKIRIKFCLFAWFLTVLHPLILVPRFGPRSGPWSGQKCLEFDSLDQLHYSFTMKYIIVIFEGL